MQKEDPMFQKDMGENGDDRRQEITFIGAGLKKDELSKALDKCLLSNDEKVCLADGISFEILVRFMPHFWDQSLEMPVLKILDIIWNISLQRCICRDWQI